MQRPTFRNVELEEAEAPTQYQPSTHREDVLTLPNRDERVAIPASFAGVALASAWKHSGNFADRRVEPLEPLYNQV